MTHHSCSMSHAAYMLTSYWMRHALWVKLSKYFIDFLTSYNGQNHIKTFFKFHAGLWKYCRSGKIQLFFLLELFFDFTYDIGHIKWKNFMGHMVWFIPYEMVNNFEINGSIIRTETYYKKCYVLSIVSNIKNAICNYI